MNSNVHFSVEYKYAEADGVKVFYREAGNPEHPIYCYYMVSQVHPISSVN